MAKNGIMENLFALPAELCAGVPKPARRRRAAALCCGVLAVAVGVGAAELLMASGEPLRDLAARLVLSCVLAGVLEEVLFRGGVFPLLIGVFEDGRHPYLRAALVQAAIFALLHLSGTVPAGMTAIVLVQALAKVVQAMAFGLIMAAVYGLTRNLAVPVVAHIAYDLLSLFPRELFLGPTATYLTGSAADAVVASVTAVALAAIAIPAWRALR
ncbi:MAG: CPBP family intramembrane metalloprotease [Eggerthellaceae bacterium]|nr:CPBP family intramembrane metalloprotease [Eggerthellaceae bacterium]